MSSPRFGSLNRRGRLRTSESVAGWVFADMLLVLFIIGLGAAFMLPKPPEIPKEEPKPKIVGMKTDPVSVSVRVDAKALSGRGDRARAAGKDACMTIRKATQRQAKTKQRAALVLIFGGAPEPSPGQGVARAIGKQLTCASDTVFVRGTPYRSFWDGSLPYGKARLEIFLFTTEAQ